MSLSPNGMTLFIWLDEFKKLLLDFFSIFAENPVNFWQELKILRISGKNRESLKLAWASYWDYLRILFVFIFLVFFLLDINSVLILKEGYLPAPGSCQPPS